MNDQRVAGTRRGFLDEYNRIMLTALQRGGRMQAMLGASGVAAGSIVMELTEVFHRSQYVGYGGAMLIGAGAVILGNGIDSLRKARRLEKEINEKSPEEVFRGMSAYL